MCSSNELSSTLKSQFHRPCTKFFTTSSVQVEIFIRSSLLRSGLSFWFSPRSGQTWMVQNRAENSLPSNSLINFPAIVSHDYSVISLALNYICFPKKLSIRRVYLAIARFDSRQQQVMQNLVSFQTTSSELISDC